MLIKEFTTTEATMDGLDGVGSSFDDDKKGESASRHHSWSGWNPRRRVTLILSTMGCLLFLLAGFNRIRTTQLDGKMTPSTRARRLQFTDGNPQSVVNTIANQLNLRAFEAYFVRSGVVPTVMGDGPFTLITPWRGAVDAMDESLKANLQNPFWGAHLQNLIQLHVFFGDGSPSTFEDGRTLTMANGEEVPLQRRPGSANQFFINGTLALAAKEATNGFLYMSDQVLMPEWVWRTLRGVLSQDYPTMLELLILAEMEEVLDGSTTIFAPTEGAFAFLGASNLDFLKSEDGRELLVSILEYHVAIGDPVGSPVSMLVLGFRFPLTLETLNGGTIELLSGKQVIVRGMMNQASVVQEDILVNNGIIHALDTVLLVMESDPETESPTTAPSTSQPTGPSTMEPSVAPSSAPTTFTQPFATTTFTELPPDASAAAERLGYSPTNWPISGLNAAVESLSWTSLSEEQRNDLIIIGYSEATWDCFVNHYEDYSWTELGEIDLVSSMETVGYSQSCWEDTTGPNCPPLTDDLDWDEMTAEVQAAFEDFCWTQTLWDNWPGLF